MELSTALATLLAAGVFATAPSQPAAPAPAIEPLAETAMEHPLERRFFAIASHDGEATIVAEVLSGRYSLDADLSSLCRDFERAEQMLSPACLVIERYDAMRAGDTARYASLYAPGSERRDELMRGENDRFRQSREQILAVKAVRPTTLMAWGDYWIVDIVAVSDRDEIMKLPVTNRFIEDPQSERLWLTDELSTLNYPIHYLPSGFGDDHVLLESVHPSMTIVRSEKVRGPENERPEQAVRAEVLDPDSIVRPTDLVLYLNEERFPIDAPPLIEIDPADLDEAGRSLQAALKLQWRWERGDQIPIDRLLNLWHPTHGDHMRQYYETQLGIVGVGDAAQNLPELRIISQVRTDSGVVSFIWYPDPTAREGTKSLALLQLLDVDDEYKLVLNSNYVRSHEFPDENKAMQLLGGDYTGYSGVPQALTRRHRAELAEPEPDSR